MDLASSDQWSTGCESGWTVYLDESYHSRREHVYTHPQSYRYNSTVNDEEDQSMVSDASSGPPQFRQEVDEQQCYSGNNNSYSTYSEKSVKRSGKKSKKKASKKVSYNNEHHQQQCNGFSSSNHHLDDTASSPTITYSHQMYGNSTGMEGYYGNTTSMEGYSQNTSAAHYQGSSYNNHYGYWQSNNHVIDPDQSAQPSNYYSYV